MGRSTYQSHMGYMLLSPRCKDHKKGKSWCSVCPHIDKCQYKCCYKSLMQKLFHPNLMPHICHFLSKNQTPHKHICHYKVELCEHILVEVHMGHAPLGRKSKSCYQKSSSSWLVDHIGLYHTRRSLCQTVSCKNHIYFLKTPDWWC